MSRQEALTVSRKGIRTWVWAFGALALAASCEQAPPEPRVRVEGPVVTLPAIPGRPGAAYFTLETNAGRTRLVSIESPRVGRVELHETVSEPGGLSRMIPLRDSSFSTEAPLVFEPGGRHAMLFDLDPNVHVGDRLALTFRFDAAPPVTIAAEVRGPGGAGPEPH